MYGKSASFYNFSSYRIFLGMLFFLEKTPTYYSPIHRNAISVFSIQQDLVLPKSQGTIEHLSYVKRLNLFILFVRTLNVYIPHHHRPLTPIFRTYIWSCILMMPLNAKRTCNTVHTVNHFHA